MSFHDASVAAYLQILGSLTGHPRQGRGALQGEEHPARRAARRPALSGHAAPHPQIQLTCDFATKGCARLTHSEVPSIPDTEKSFEDLKARLAKTIDYVKAFKPAQFDGADPGTSRFRQVPIKPRP